MSSRKPAANILAHALAALFTIALVGCASGGDGKKNDCEAGTTVSCLCLEGAVGTGECLDEGKVGPCNCSADAGGDAELADEGTQEDSAQDSGVEDVLVDAPGDTAEPDTGVDVIEDEGVEDIEPEIVGPADVTEDVEEPDEGMTDTGVDLTEPGDTGPVDGDEPPPFDCANIPQGPFQLVKLQGPMASEDLDFDMEGNVIGSNDKAIFRSGYNQGPKVFVPEMKFRAGMRFLPNGHLVVCDNQKGQLVRIDTEGNKFPLMVGLSYPNGITVDMEGWVYFTEHDANKVWRVHPFTGEHTLLTDKISNPNGLTFSPDYKTLYIGGFNGGKTIWAMSISSSGTPGKLVAWAKVGTGWHDGMGTDICGNVYIADYYQTVIYRISPDGQDTSLVIDGSNIDGAYLPNLKWGSGIGGWSKTKLYLPDGWNKGVFEVDIGVPSAPTPYP